MSRQVFVHVGDCKTGSTAIQAMLASGACAIEGKRLMYPAPGLQAALPGTLTKKKGLYEKRWSTLAGRMAETGWDIAVISSELFEFIPPGALAAALDEFLPVDAAAVRIVIYVRPHAGRLLSQFAENLNLGHDLGDFRSSYDRLARAGRFAYAARLDRWAEAFGGRLIVRPFVRSWLAEGDVRRDFLARIAGGAPFSLAPADPANDSLPLGDLVLMRMLQRGFAGARPEGHQNHVAFGKHFARILREFPPARPAQRLCLPRGIYEDLRALCIKDAERMDRDWFGAPCFVPALEEAAAQTVPEAQSLEPEDHFDAETLRLMRCWAELIGRQMDDKQQLFARRLRGAPE